MGVNDVVLDNILGITNPRELAVVEEQYSKMRAVELFEVGVLDRLKPGSYVALAKIHQYLFQDVYPFAGKMRSVNIAKGNFRFAPAIYLEAAVQNIERMPQKTYDQIVEKYVEMNVAHPFREGNGRSTRIWLDCILKRELGYVVDWSQVNKTDYLFAMERSPIRDLEIKALLKPALTADIDNREVYMKGIDASYRYEGYQEFKTAELVKRRLVDSVQADFLNQLHQPTDPHKPTGKDEEPKR